MKHLLVALSLVACDGGVGWLEDSRMIVDGYDETNMDCRTGPCGHDEDTDLIVFGGATYLVHRTALSQVLGPNSSLRVYRSDDHGASWTVLSVIPAPIDRDLRDPCFYVDASGQLSIKAITRIAHNSTRDSDVMSVSVRTATADGGASWSPLVAIGPETWSFWRIHADANGTLYSAAYGDGDTTIRLFSSSDGVTWQPGAVVYDVAQDTPGETELVFTPEGLTALVRLDGTDDEILGSMGRLRTKICKAPPPYATFDCSGTLDGVRLDGPLAFPYGGREWIIARKHFLEVANRKRTALYELVGDAIVEHGEFPSTGDTAYAGIAPIKDGRFVVSYYSSNITQDSPWARAIFGPTDIWQATIDLTKL